MSATARVPAACKLERYFAEHEFKTRYLLCCSDVEALTMQELLDMADPEMKDMWSNLKLSYTESEGSSLLRSEAAKLHGVSADDILVTVPQEGIYIAMNCLTKMIIEKSGGPFHAIATYPAYQSLYENLRTLNCDLDYWTVTDTEAGWDLSLDQLNQLIKPTTKLLVVNFPHNPTGFVPTSERWQAIIELCRSRGIFLFSDEMYRLSNNDGTEALQSACAMYENAVTLGGMSKTFALPGLRIGWVATKCKELMEMMASFKDYTTICSPGPCELLAIIGLRNYPAIVQRTQDIVQPNLALLDVFFSRYPELFKWHRPRACTTGFLELRSPLLSIEGGGATGFCKALLREYEVLLLPGDMYDFSDNYVRLGFARRDMPQALHGVEAFIHKHVKGNK